MKPFAGSYVNLIEFNVCLLAFVVSPIKTGISVGLNIKANCGVSASDKIVENVADSATTTTGFTLSNLHPYFE